VVECAGLEIRYTVLPYRGFESLLLRQEQAQAIDSLGLFFCAGLSRSIMGTQADTAAYRWRLHGRRGATDTASRARGPTPVK